MSAPRVSRWRLYSALLLGGVLCAMLRDASIPTWVCSFVFGMTMALLFDADGAR